MQDAFIHNASACEQLLKRPNKSIKELKILHCSYRYADNLFLDFKREPVKSP